MLTAVCWVPKGVAKAIPDTIERTEEEIHAIVGVEDAEDLEQQLDERSCSENEESDADEMELENGEVATALAAASALGRNKNKDADTAADLLQELNMDDYDDEDEDIKIFGNGGLGSAYYKNGEKDPYIIDEDEDEEELDDKRIKPSDLLLLTARNEDDASVLEVLIYEEGDEENMYVHHELLLPAMPLCLAWLDCNAKNGEKGNFVAVGSMQPGIEIWNLDTLDEVEPVAVLGGKVAQEKQSLKKKKKKKKENKENKEAVLGLSWNHEYRNVLASGNADSTVKIWDVVAQKCEQTFHCHSKNVQAVVWHSTEPTSLLSGSFDCTVVLTDMRTPDKEALRWTVTKDVECLAWNPHAPHSFVVSTEDGLVCGFDVRTASVEGPNTSMFKIDAHQKATCVVSYNAVVPNLLATASMDKTVKLWDVSENKAVCIASSRPRVGALMSGGFCKDSPFLFAVGGSKGKLHVWNTLTESEVARRYGKLKDGEN